MLDTTHALTGLVIGKYLENPGLAFVVGVFSHFLLDALPHWDGAKTLNVSSLRNPNGVEVGQERISFSREGKIILTLDILASLIIFLFLSLKGPLWPNFFELRAFIFNLYSHLSWVTGVLGALLPDILLLVYIFYPNERLRRISLFEFHKRIQKKMALVPGLLFQVGLCLFWIMIFIK